MVCSTPGFLSFPISQNLLEFISIESVMPSNHLILCHPLLLPSIFPSIRVFPNESALHFRWSDYWSFSFSISPSSEYSGLISFRIDWFDLLAVHGTRKSLLQHHSLKSSILRCLAFFMVPTCPVLKKAMGFTWEMCCSWPTSICYPEDNMKKSMLLACLFCVHVLKNQSLCPLNGRGRMFSMRSLSPLADLWLRRTNSRGESLSPSVIPEEVASPSQIIPAGLMPALSWCPTNVICALLEKFFSKVKRKFREIWQSSFLFS